jgi:hypothetical protein
LDVGRPKGGAQNGVLAIADRSAPLFADTVLKDAVHLTSALMV